MTIEAVIFDIGNVLVEWHPERPFDRLIGAQRRAALFARVDFDGMNIRSDMGEDMYQGVEALAAAHPDDADEIRIWADHWLEMLAPDLPGTAALLRALRARGVAVHALSNFGGPTFRLAEETYPILKEFDRRFISANLGVIKPDPAIYAHVEAALGLAPETLLFIDDRDDNIAAAQERGWQGHVFEDAAGLAECLVALGLLTPAEAAP